jgi:cysteine desulfurase
MPPIYLDNNATTKPLDAVVEQMDRTLREVWANPSSMHRPGQQARQMIELARQRLGSIAGSRPRYLTLTSSGTEAIDLAIRGALLAQGRLGARRRHALGGSIITTKVEHSAVRQLVEALEREEGVRIHFAQIAPGGVVDLAHVDELLQSDPDVALVSVQWANNETGTVQPVRELIELCRNAPRPPGAGNVLFHCDATQWIGRMPASAEHTLDADLLTYSPHKFHGPKGIGVLIAKAGVSTSPLIHGEQELGRRGGTENVPGIVGAGVAADAAISWLSDPTERARIASLRDQLEHAVLDGFPDATINGILDEPGEPPGTRRLYNTTNIAFPRLEAEALLLLLSERGVCASAGAACSSGSLDPSPVLQAMGIPPERAHGSLRFSLSRFTTPDDIAQASKTIVESAKRLAGSMSALGQSSRDGA